MRPRTAAQPRRAPHTCSTRCSEPPRTPERGGHWHLAALSLDPQGDTPLTGQDRAGAEEAAPSCAPQSCPRAEKQHRGPRWHQATHKGDKQRTLRTVSTKTAAPGWTPVRPTRATAPTRRGQVPHPGPGWHSTGGHLQLLEALPATRRQGTLASPHVCCLAKPRRGPAPQRACPPHPCRKEQ